MKYRNAFIFIATIVVVPYAMAGALIAFDVYLYLTGQQTISEQVTALSPENPIIPFGLGLLVGTWIAAGIALAFHFWFGMTRPSLLAEFAAAKADAQAAPALRIQVAALKVDCDAVRAEKGMIEGQLAHYRRRVVDLEFQLSDCRSAERNEHGFPRIADTPET